MPFHVFLLAVVVIPVCIAVLLGTRAFQGMTPLVFRCRRCNGEFRRRPHRRFPVACPRCRSRHWND
jgi:Zn finger protein HypA/HybF involved in hydrogenase expression